MRVLVIDDSDDDRELTGRELRKELPSADISGIGTRNEFEAALVGPPPSLVILDYSLGWSEGIQVAQQIKAAFPDCAVIMFTGTLGEDYAVEAMKAGLDDYIVKSAGRLPRLRAAVHSALKQVEDRQARRAAEADRDVLLLELLHRVHNNLQIVLGLLLMHSRRMNDPDAKRSLDSIARRVQALAEVQRRLYQGGNYLALNFGRYLLDLSEALGSLGAQGRDISLHRNLMPVEIPIEKAAPLALIANELLTNAYDHAFEGRDRGKIWIDLAPSDALGAVLTITDDGVGHQESKRKGIGSQLIRLLSTQIEAEVVTTSTPGSGTSVTVRFGEGVGVRAA